MTGAGVMGKHVLAIAFPDMPSARLQLWVGALLSGVITSVKYDPCQAACCCVSVAFGCGRLALNQSDDAAFKRVVNVPKRRLGPKLMEQLETEQFLAMDALTGSQQQQQQEGAGAPATSLFSVAERLLREKQIASAHAKSLGGFLNVVKQLSWVVKGADPAEAVLAVLQQVPSLVDFIRQRHLKARKQAEGETVAEQAAGSEDEGDEGKEQQPHGTANRDPQQHKSAVSSSHAAAAPASCGFSSARQCQQQEQECESHSLMGTEDHDVEGEGNSGDGDGAAADDVESDDEDDDGDDDEALASRSRVPEPVSVADKGECKLHASS